MVVYCEVKSLRIDEIVELNDVGHAIEPRLDLANNNQGTQALLVQVSFLQWELQQFKEAVANSNWQLQTNIDTKMLHLNWNVCWLAVIPAQQANNALNPLANTGGADTTFVASLMSNPKDLYILWQEYKFGVGGRKPAQKFTASERGKVKHKYHCRKVFWDLISEMVRSGKLAEVAINQVYSVYGYSDGITKILNLMHNNQKQNYCHPQLQV